MYGHAHLSKSPSGVWTGRLRERCGMTEFHDRDLQVVLVKAAIHLGVEQVSPEFSESISALRNLFDHPAGGITRDLAVVFGSFAASLLDMGLSKPEIELLLPGVVDQISAWEVEAGGFSPRCS